MAAKKKLQRSKTLKKVSNTTLKKVYGE